MGEQSPAPGRPSTYGPYAAASVVVANMIGTGVFTSLGFQLADIRSTFVLLLLWVVGGVAAFCGAVSYAELGAAIPRSGGEYAFLSRIYHPAAGFVSGWVSATVGFAAPTALAAMTFGAYLSSVIPTLEPTLLALGLVAIFTMVHATSHRTSGAFQTSFTTVKVILIVGFCLAAVLLTADPQTVVVLPTSGDEGLVFSSAFAVSLIYVSYAYTGWNAATYLTGEVERPTRTLPIILAGGTALVTVLYVGLNYAFLRAAPMAEMVGRVEVGYVAAGYIFGPRGADLMGIALALLLVSTVSAMILAGPRVLQVIGEDYRTFHWLSRKNRDGIPGRAVLAQGLLTAVFIATASFESILVFSGFTLGLNSFLAVAGVLVFRVREPEAPRPYRTWAFPAPPLFFLAVTGWTLVYLAVERPQEAAMAGVVVVVGMLVYLLTGGGRSPAP